MIVIDGRRDPADQPGQRGFGRRCATRPVQLGGNVGRAENTSVVVDEHRDAVHDRIADAAGSILALGGVAADTDGAAARGTPQQRKIGRGGRDNACTQAFLAVIPMGSECGKSRIARLERDCLTFAELGMHLIAKSRGCERS